MEKEVFSVEGINIEVERVEKDDKEARRRMMAYIFSMVRKESGMNRVEFAKWLDIPYRTMQEWELGRRAMPDYLLNLIAYKVFNEKEKGRI